jgi:hypothetical protein
MSLRVLALLFALFGLPALAADYTPWPDAEAPAGTVQLAQQSQQPGPGAQPPGQPQRHPGDYCCRHCRWNEVACGDKCLPKSGSKPPLCAAKTTCACPGKP